MNSSDTPVSLQDSPDNHGAVVNIVSWFLLVFSSLLILTRLGTKWAVSRVLHVDDGMIVLSLVESRPSQVPVPVPVPVSPRLLGTIQYNIVQYQGRCLGKD